GRGCDVQRQDRDAEEGGSTPLTPVTVAPGLTGIVRLGVLVVEGARNGEAVSGLDALLAEAEAAVRRTPPAESQAVRAMYRRVGIDPTKTRPSSEALLRRVRRGDRLPRI